MYSKFSSLYQSVCYFALLAVTDHKIQRSVAANELATDKST